MRAHHDGDSPEQYVRTPWAHEDYCGDGIVQGTYLHGVARHGDAGSTSTGFALARGVWVVFVDGTRVTDDGPGEFA